MLLKMSADSVSMPLEYIVGSEGYTDWVNSESEEMATAVDRKGRTLVARDTSSAMRCVKGERHWCDLSVQDVSDATITATIIVNFANHATLRH